MRERRGSVIDRRSGKDRRKAHDLQYSLCGGKERRNFRERRFSQERRAGWVRVGQWYSVYPWAPKDSQILEFK